MAEKIDWFEMWRADKESILATMVGNMKSDLDAGYDYFGNSIQRQLKEIEDYRENYRTLMDYISFMDEKKVNHWCYVQLLKSGAIS